jgi:mannose-6-phosphate isomerase
MELLAVRKVEKVWGRDALPPPFTAPEGKRIGEIWFEPPTRLDSLLAKYLFTSEKLSVQVHPDDARAPDGSRGKDECWLVLEAEPGARLGIGFDRPVSPGEMRETARDGSIEQLMTWHRVRQGDFFYLPAGTVHAIGAGLTIIEIQRNSDVTYRLYDYGRPRELHLDEGIEVASGEPYRDERQRHVAPDETVRLVDGPHFRLDQLVGPPSDELRARYDRPVGVMLLSGSALIEGQAIAPGQCAVADSARGLEAGEGARLLLFAEAAG